MPSPATATLTLDRPISETREYRHVVLKNKLEALLISDPACDKAAGSLSVKVGSSFDPVDFPGLAHFLEHMLFLGTEKYPDENEYNRFLQQHGGQSNAFTSDFMTCYHFSVAPEHLEGALDRFAQFFLTPRFTVSATDRELDAVHSEHINNLLSDKRRVHQLVKHLANPKHPFHKFGTGSNETLRNLPASRGLDTRNALLEFYRQYYSANIMRLCLLGRQSLDELEEWIQKARFNCIANSDVHIPRDSDIGAPEPVYRPQDLQTLVHVVPVRDLRSIMFQWTLPEQTELWESKPTSYISHLLGHEGKGSLLSALKAKGLATELSVGIYAPCGGVALFRCTIQLTEKGIDAVDEVGKLVHDYLRLLKENPIQSWVNDELKTLADIRFRFSPLGSPASHVVHMTQNMHYYPPQRLLSGPCLIWETNETLIRQMLDCLTADRLMVFVVNQAFKADVERKESEGSWLREPFYEVRYQKKKLPDTLLHYWNAPRRSAGDDVALTFPQPNIFIPKDLSLREHQTTTEYPQKLACPPTLQAITPHIYFKQDTTFRLPKTMAFFQFSSPFARKGLRESLLLQLYCLATQQHINEYAYDAEVAGLHYALTSSLNSGLGRELTNGFELQLGGFTDSLATYLSELCRHITTPSFQREQFDIAKTILCRELKIMAKNQQPWRQAINLRSQLTQLPYYTPEECLQAVTDLTYDDVLAAAPDMMSGIIVEGLIQGNAVESEAIQYLTMIDQQFLQAVAQRTSSEHTMGGSPLWRPSRVPDLATLEGIPAPVRLRLTMQASNPEEKNHAVVVVIQVGVLDILQATLLNVARKYLHEPFFDSLRTKQQLGYTVGCRSIKTLLCDELMFIVQSQWLEPRGITTRIEAFLEHYLEHVEERLTEEEFMKLRDATISDLEEKPKNLIEEVSRNWDEVLLRRFQFNRRQQQSEILKSCTRDAFITFVKNTLLKKPWIAVEVRAAQTTSAAPPPTKAVDLDLSSESESPLEPKIPVAWMDVMGSPADFVTNATKHFFEFPLPGTTAEKMS